MARTNLREIEAAFEELLRCCELDQPAASGSGKLADAIFDVDVQGIQRRSIQGQHGPAGENWPPNEPNYKARKGGLPIGVLTGEMLSESEVSGERSISPNRAEMRYGKTGWAKQKAQWFEEGTGRQPERPFYSDAPEDDAAKSQVVNDQIEAAIRRFGG